MIFDNVVISLFLSIRGISVIKIGDMKNKVYNDISKYLREEINEKKRYDT